jgi:hypothetical protein
MATSKKVTKPATKAVAKKSTNKVPTPAKVEAPAAAAAPAKVAEKPAANLKIEVVSGASNTARPGSKRHFWIAAVMAAKSVNEAIKPSAKIKELAPTGTADPTMHHVNWCVKHKLIKLGTPVA